MTTILRIALAAAIGVPALAPARAAFHDTGVSAAVSADTMEKRSKPRQKGGSGCDDPHDIVEHPECR